MKVIARNQKAGFDNEIIEKIVAGIVLDGHEVKSVKNGEISIDGAYVFVSPSKAILRNALIHPWQHANSVSLTGYDKTRDRILLLTKKQLLYLVGKRQQLRAQVVPLMIGLDHNLIKLEIALARPLKKYDKKDRRKEREEIRTMQRIAKTVEIRR